ncbi:Transcription initiation factor IIA large subunit [Zancudomyces culisetae]|uniref:Transcription initiation factor IIA large subunit n=1 Tax=Zancudomyces culisetae TaxID=1213189 RepID=A0A1R1PUW0_ZANCU|nr:Transcription initiation factor IIA large subunit [Zancudomyces culisetae]|eukprot:OMH84758.1 Transcription initiation factor IIA large subunit [Zancudomyces culisetae]
MERKMRKGFVGKNIPEFDENLLEDSTDDLENETLMSRNFEALPNNKYSGTSAASLSSIINTPIAKNITSAATLATMAQTSRRSVDLDENDYDNENYSNEDSGNEEDASGRPPAYISDMQRKQFGATNSILGGDNRSPRVAPQTGNPKRDPAFLDRHNNSGFKIKEESNMRDTASYFDQNDGADDIEGIQMWQDFVEKRKTRAIEEMKQCKTNVDNIEQTDGDTSENHAQNDENENDFDNALNSDLDDSEEEVEDGTEYLSRMILCQYDKVTKSKNRWKCVLKDGIMLVNNKNYLFHKATGDFEW